MADSADPINHDGASTVATVGGKVAKWGLIGAVAAVAVPAVLGTAAILSFVAAASAATWAGSIALAAVGAAAGVAAVQTFGFAAAGAVGGAALGFLKGSDQVSKETNSFRAKVVARMNGAQNKDAKNFNDGEVKGIEEGYTIAMQDMKQQMQAQREVGRQEGAQAVVAQIQQHMEEQMKMAEQQQQGAEGHHAKRHAKEHASEMTGHEAHGSKPPVTIGGKVIASCECPDGSKAAAIAENRAEAGLPSH